MIGIVDRLKFDAVRCETQFSKGVASNITEAAGEIERLRNLAADLMDLAAELPIKHPQQETRRKILRGQCEMFGVYQQTAVKGDGK